MAGQRERGGSSGCCGCFTRDLPEGPLKPAISQDLYFCLVFVAFLTLRFYLAFHYSSGTWDYFYKSNRDSSSHTWI